MTRRIFALLLTAVLIILPAGCAQTSDSEEPAGISRPSAFVDALKNGEIKSVLVVGDSISDGNGDVGCLWSNEDRIAANCRLILTDDAGESYYENALNSQGWVKYLREEVNGGVDIFHNAAIGGKSAKWFNAHKERLFLSERSEYDAIFAMLGTNDRTDCENVEEFRVEYGSLLAYLQAHCKYLTGLVPIPAICDLTDSGKNISSAQIAENVRLLCEENGYSYIDCYRDFPQYAADNNISLGRLYWGGTHPSVKGYEVLWRSIAHTPAGHTKPEEPESIVCIGQNLDMLLGDTPADAVNKDGMPIYPIGVSWYYTWNAFTPELPYGAFLETHREGNGSAVQYAYSHQYLPSEFSYVRHYQNGNWSEWETS